MKELALHVLDIAQNSVRAQATKIEIEVKEDISENWLVLKVADNGSGIDQPFLESITNPFTTTRTLRKVGLGIPFMAQMCKECEGELDIQSELGKGTVLTAKMKYDHIDRLPLGRMDETMITLIMAKPEIHFIYRYAYEEESFCMDTEEIKQLLGEVPIQDLSILEWLRQYIQNGTELLKK